MDDSERASKASIAEIEGLVREIEELSDPHARAVAVKLVAAVMEFHASAVERMLELAGEDAARRMTRDDLAASLLVLHGLHPDDVETRISRAVEKLNRFFDVKLAGFENGIVRLSFRATRAGSTGAAKDAIESAIYQAAPEIAGLTVEGLAEEVREPGFVPLSALIAAPAR